jgi:hypothetical protein
MKNQPIRRKLKSTKLPAGFTLARGFNQLERTLLRMMRIDQVHKRASFALTQLLRMKLLLKTD